MFFLLPAFWGLADAVWQTQLNGNLLQLTQNLKQNKIINH